MSVRIVTDSTSDIPAEIAAKHGITVVPVHVKFEDQTYRDGVDISRQEIYDLLPDHENLPTTSAPGPGEFVSAYKRLADEGATDIVSIHISPKLSGVLNAANSAAQAVSDLGVKVFNSEQLTLGTGFMALAAAEAAAAGASIGEVIALLEDLVGRTYTFAAPETLEYLRRGGRLTPFQAGLASLLRIKPLLRVHNGETTMERIRTHKKLMERMIAVVKSLAPLERMAVVHASAREAAANLAEQLASVHPAGQDVLIAEVTPAIGVHIGPGSVGVACVQA